MADDRDDDWLPPDVWAAATDPSLPPGVIALQGSDGRWWRYPLAEFDG